MMATCTGANNKEKRVFVALSYHATYTFHSDTGAEYLACRQRLRTTDVTAIHVGKGGESCDRESRCARTGSSLRWLAPLAPRRHSLPHGATPACVCVRAGLQVGLVSAVPSHNIILRFTKKSDQVCAWSGGVCLCAYAYACVCVCVCVCVCLLMRTLATA